MSSPIPIPIKKTTTTISILIDKSPNDILKYLIKTPNTTPTVSACSTPRVSVSEPMSPETPISPLQFEFEEFNIEKVQ